MSRVARSASVPIALLVAAVVCAAAPVAEASFARRLGGKVSRNPSTATQQLTADPPRTVDGTVGVKYDPTLVSLYFPPDPVSVNSALFVNVTGFNLPEILIGVLDGEGNPEFINPGRFVDTGLPRTEIGEIRVSFSRTDEARSPVVLPPGGGYGPYVFGPGYEQGDDLFGVVFYERASYTDRDVIPDALPVAAPYSLFVPPDETIRVLLNDDDTEPTTLNPGDVEPGTVTLPEPGALGLLAVAGLLAMRRPRRLD